MWEFESEEEDGSATVFRDVLMLALIGFVAIVIMLLPHLSSTQEKKSEQRAPGSVVVEMHWPDHLPVDVDLWVRAPGDIAVGFWNQGSEFFNLLRDDLGLDGDSTQRNYEVSYSRGIPPGEYVVNVHMYGVVPHGVVVPVKVVVSVRERYDQLRQILQTEVELYRRNQEETAFRFELRESGELVEDSVSTLRKRLVTVPQT